MLMLAELSARMLHSRVDAWRHRGGMSCACHGRLEMSRGRVEICWEPPIPNGLWWTKLQNKLFYFIYFIWNSLLQIPGIVRLVFRSSKWFWEWDSFWLFSMLRKSFSTPSRKFVPGSRSALVDSWWLLMSARNTESFGDGISWGQMSDSFNSC